MFVNLLNKHSLKTPLMYKLFNRNTVKLSYICTSNLSNIIKRLIKRNSNLEEDETGGNKVVFNCRIKKNGSLIRICCRERAVYCAKVENDSGSTKSTIVALGAILKSGGITIPRHLEYKDESSVRSWRTTIEKWKNSGHEYFNGLQKLIKGIANHVGCITRRS